jgi:hypothetical protein
VGEPAIVSLEAEILPGQSVYSPGQVIGGLVEAGPVYGYAGLMLSGVSLLDEANQGPSCGLHIFDRQPNILGDYAPFTPGYSDLQKRMLRVELTPGDYETINGMKVAYKETSFNLLPNNRLWLYLVCGGTPVFGPGKRLFIRLFLGG